MVVKDLFGQVNYPEDIKQREAIVKEYKSKTDNLINSSSKEKKFKMSLFFEVISLLCIVSIFILESKSVVLKLLYAVPCIVFTIYDFSLLCSIKRKNYKDEKSNYKKEISQLFSFILLIYMGTYLFETIILKDELTIFVGIISWAIFMVLSIGTALKAIKNAPDKFLNMYLNTKNKQKLQPSWALNVTRALIVIVCLLKPYLLLMAMSYIIISPLMYVMVYSYYTYLQYDEIQNLLK